MSDYIAKPVEEEDLFRVLARWLRTDSFPERSGDRPTSSGLPSSLPGLDLEAGLRKASGNSELYRRLLISFGRDNATLASLLKRCLERGDAATALPLLHTLKGSAATLGADRVARSAASLESAVGEGGAWNEDLAELTGRLEEVLKGTHLITPVPNQESTDSQGEDALDGAAAREALPILYQLAKHLAENNLAATRCYGELRSVLGRNFSGSMGELSECLDRLDFEAAGSHLEMIRAAVESAVEES